MAQAMRPPASPVGSVLSDTHSMNLGTAQALAFCRVRRKASADDTVSPARSRPPMSKTSGSKHCGPRCWTISVCAAPSSRRRRGQRRRGFCRRTNSHHFGATARHIEPVGADGLVGLALGNSPSAMGRHAGVVRHQSDRRGLPASRRTWSRRSPGARMGFEASSLSVDEGDKPRIGRAFLVIDPGRWRAARSTMPGWKSCFLPFCITKLRAY
jgi:hypothetical protein